MLLADDMGWNPGGPPQALLPTPPSSGGMPLFSIPRQSDDTIYLDDGLWLGEATVVCVPTRLRERGRRAAAADDGIVRREG